MPVISLKHSCSLPSLNLTETFTAALVKCVCLCPQKSTTGFLNIRTYVWSCCLCLLQSHWLVAVCFLEKWIFLFWKNRKYAFYKFNRIIFTFFTPNNQTWNRPRRNTPQRHPKRQRNQAQNRHPATTKPMHKTRRDTPSRARWNFPPRSCPFLKQGQETNSRDGEEEEEDGG